MQAINIAAYKRLGDSYAEENGDVEVIESAASSGKDGYEQLQGNSDSECGYQTAPESESERAVDSTNSAGYQNFHRMDESPGHNPTSCGYQSLESLLTDGGRSYKGHGAIAVGETTRLDKPNVFDPAEQSGYLRLEGYSEFCGNPEKPKLTETVNGYSVIGNGKDSGNERQQLWTDPQKVETDEFEVSQTCYACSFRGVLKIIQAVCCIVALGCGLVPRFWTHTPVGIWFLAANVTCSLVASTVLLAQIYNEMDRCCLCRRKLVQILYLLMIPLLLSAGLLAASVSSSARIQPEFDRNMVMLSAMFTLLGLFAVITDVVMHRRMWNMFQMAGSNAYIHAAFMA